MEPGGEREPITICGYENRYDRILETTLNKYADVLYGGCCKDGYNLALRMKEYQEAYLLFLHNSRVPAASNLAGRPPKFIEWEQNPAMSLWSVKSLELFCDNMSVLFLVRKEGDSLYDRVSIVFG